MSEWEGDERRWAEYLARAQRGDGEAYRCLLRELERAFRAYLIVRFGRSELLDDCVQECLLAVHEARHTYDPGRPVRPWLFAIVRNRTIDVLRRQPRSANGARGQEPPKEPDYADAIDSERLLGRLSKTLREPLVLTKMVGLSTRECAERLGVSEGAVKVRVFRGLRKLRELLEAEAT